MTFRLTTRPGHPTFIDLPWEVPLESWESGRLVTPVRGISRHVVRFVAYGDALYALKETVERAASREYRLLRELEARKVPVVEAVGVATGRVGEDGEELGAVLITRYLEYSLPYRTLFSRRPSAAEPWEPLLDALAQLLVQLHLVGFFWGDCSLSNTLFRRDAGALAASLVDAETGELQPPLSPGQRDHDVTIAEENVAGELLDLIAAGRLDDDLDVATVAESLRPRYAGLWAELTREVEYRSTDRHLVEQRIRRLNDLGFDVAEINLVRTDDGNRMRLSTEVVESGHHRRRLLTLTGLDVGENQARRLLNDIRSYRAWMECDGVAALSESVAAVRWLVEAFEPAIAQVPPELRGKLEPAELYHQILEHRWFLSEEAGEDVGTEEAVASYVAQVLPSMPDERKVLDDPVRASLLRPPPEDAPPSRPGDPT